MSKSFVWGFIAGVALLIIAGVGASRLQDKNAKLKDAEEKQYQIEVVDATPVELGALTPVQRIHSQAYTGYLERRGGRTISGLVAQAQGKSKLVKTIAFIGLTEVLTEPETPENYFGKLGRASDAVVRGKAVRKVSQITENDAFIFTDYDLVVTEVLKNNAAAPINVDSTITITRPGGKVLLDGTIVEAVDRAFDPLPINNHEVILFLRFIPETGAYKSTEDTGSFELRDSIPRPLTGEHFPPNVIRDKDSFLQTLRAISKQ